MMEKKIKNYDELLAKYAECKVLLEVEKLEKNACNCGCHSK